MPAWVGAGVAVYGAFKSSSSQDKQQKMADAASAQQAQLSRTLADYASKQYGLTQPALGKAIDYYSTIAGGNRGAIQSAIAPEVAGLTDAYAGTQKYLEQQGIRGGARDVALAQANQAKAGQIGMLPFQARQQAIGQLGALGMGGTQQALQGLSAASGAAGGAGQTAIGSGYLGIAQGQQTAGFGSSIAQLLMPYLLNQKSGGGASGPGSFGFSPYSGGALTGPWGASGWSSGLQQPLTSRSTVPGFTDFTPS